MDFVSAKGNQLPQALFNELNEYRYKVFIEKLGWDLQTPEDQEIDQFDTVDAVYVIARNEQESITGCARLLPTTKPYLLEKIFPELLNGSLVPKHDDIWELSRFTALDLASMPKTASQLSSPQTLRLLEEVISCARSYGAKQLISVSPIGVERLLRNTGYKVHRAGPPKVVNGHPLLACWIDLI